MNKVLINTDVILDFFFDRKPFVDYSTEVLILCEKGEIKGYITPVIISNLYYLLRKISKYTTVIEKLKQLSTIIDVIKIDKKSVINALESDFKDFEDALQNFSATECSIDIIITRNVKDFKNSKLIIMTPETFVKGREALI